VLIVWVGYQYFMSRKAVRSSISLALVALTILIAVKNISGVVVYLSLARYYGADVGLHMMPLSILDLAIVALLLWIVRR